MGVEELLDRLLLKLSGRRVVPPSPQGSAPSVPSDDATEAAESSGEGVPLALFIEYRDSKGQVSHRRIACKRYEPANATLLAYCFERRAYRRFRVDRIVTCACPRTGEIFALAEVVSGLAAGGLPFRDDRLGRVLTVLIFLMQCDREEHPIEREVIEDAAGTFALRFDGDDEMVAEGLRVANRMAPDAEDFVGSLRWIAARPERAKLARLVKQYAERVIVADGRITSEEAYFGGVLGDALQRMMA